MFKVKPYLPLYWLIIVHVCYFITALHFRGFYLIDSFGYAMQADNMLANGSWYAEDWNAPLLVDYFSIRPPLYAGLIAFFRMFSESIVPVLVFQNIISICACWLVYVFVKQNGYGSANTQRWFMIAVSLYPAQMIHANFVMTEILFQLWLVCILITLFRFMQKPSFNKSLWLAVLLSLCLLTKPISLFLPLIVWGFMLYYIFKQKVSWQWVVPQLIVVLTFHSICFQNQHATGYYHYSSIKSINQLKYNARYTLLAAKGETFADSAIAAVMEEANAAPNYGARLTIMNDRANSFIFQHPFSFAKVFVKGVVAFFIDPGRFDMFHFFALEEKGTLGLMHETQTRGASAIESYIQKAPIGVLLLLLVGLLWNIVVICLFVYALLKMNHKPLRNMLLLMVAYIALATGPVGVSRYRVPIFPLLLIGVLCPSYSFTRSKSTQHA